MQNRFAERNYLSPGATDDELPGLGRRIAPASRACCCPAMPAVTVIMPRAAHRRRSVDLLLCGHHYRASQAALCAAGATAYDSVGTLIMPAIGEQPASPASPPRLPGTTGHLLRAHRA
jgi:hypothetical protein